MERREWEKRFNAQGEVAFAGDAGIADKAYLADLVKSTNAGSAQLTGLAKQWEFIHKNANRMLLEELDALDAQKQEAEKQRQMILKEDLFLKVGTESQRSFLEPSESEEEEGDLCSSISSLPSLEDSSYWKSKAMKLDRLLRESLDREDVLFKKRRGELTLPVSDLEKYLERPDNFLHFILRNSPVIPNHKDKELRFRFIYNQLPSIQSEIIGKTDLEIYNGKNSQETVDFLKEVLQRRQPAKREFVYEDERFGVRVFLNCCEPVFSRMGDEVIGLNSIGIDITEEFLSREKIASIKEEAAVQRSRESELQKTMRITEETMKSKQLLAKMSHEIRSPLAAIVSIAEVLSSMKLDAGQRLLVGSMVDSGHMVMQLINDILDLSKAESGAMKLELTNFRPREVVRGLLQTAAASPYMQDKARVTLEGLVCDDVPLELNSDVLRLRQILTNLVSNACKFTKEGHVKVTVRVANRDREGTDGTIRLEYQVSDTGIGIPEADLPSASHARIFDGTGLGLAICKELVELMGGDLRMSSQEGRGSTFTFTLTSRIIKDCKLCPSDSSSIGRFKFYPVNIRSMKPESWYPQASYSPCSSPTGYNASQSTLRSLKVLLAEDNNVNVLVAQSVLKRLGLEAKVVNNGAEAVQAARQGCFDLILMDVSMPVMDGLEATRLIRADEERSSGSSSNCRRSSIIALTADVSQECMDECYASGMDWFIAKPLSSSILQQAIHQLIQRR